MSSYTYSQSSVVPQGFRQSHSGRQPVHSSAPVLIYGPGHASLRFQAVLHRRVVGIVGPADRLLLTIDQVLRAYEEGWFRHVQRAGVPCGPDHPFRRRCGRGPLPGDFDPRTASMVRVFFSWPSGIYTPAGSSTTCAAAYPIGSSPVRGIPPWLCSDGRFRPVTPRITGNAFSCAHFLCRPPSMW